jgi:hypothetical protein
MPFLALLSAFAPILSNLIPQIASVFAPQGAVAQRNVKLAETLVNTITTAAGSPTLEGAVQAMQSDPAVQTAVQRAVVTHPDVLPFIEVGGGIIAARDADLKAQAAEKPFYKASPVFWVSVLMLPMVYWLVGSLIVGGVEIPTDWPAWAQFPFKLFGTAWNGESRSGGFNLVVGLVLGGICGVYYGVSVTKGANAAPTTESGK